MKPFLKILSVFLAHSAAAGPIQDFWFNGAEISSYTLSQSRYGSNHPGHAELVYVTEPFLTEKQVKNENGGEPTTDVLKLNALTTFNTGLYSYRTMTSTFRPIDVEKFPFALKTSTSVQDWCGQSFQQANLVGNEWHIELRSYFEDEGDQELTIPETHTEDGIWITLRLNPKELPTGNISMIPGAVFTRFNHQPVQTTPAKAELKAGGKDSIYTITYPSLKRTLSIRFDTKFPHIIRGWTENIGDQKTTATLNKRLMNVYYWEQHNPGDASKRKSLGLQPIAD
ncbi:septum formation inhibitor Maf [Luteolibacter sp. AS25]|uniref:septum formation inhibitor Maf n=1 Tax=Luteolibacter sp. AS25 TaxID=3135776 RepID=UPI00398A6766